MTRRREFSTKVKLHAFIRCNGRCERCGSRLSPGKYRYDHDTPDWMGGDPTLENCVVACSGCDGPKTAADQSAIAKTKRQMAKHVGAYSTAHPLPCGRRSKWKKKVDGSVVLRDAERQP